MLSTLSGEFADRDRERAFRAATLAEARAHVGLTVATASLAFALFSVLDVTMAPTFSAWPTWAVTGCRAAVLLAALLVLDRLPSLADPVALERLQLGFQAVFMLAAATIHYIASARLAAGEVASESAVLNWASLYLILLLSYLAFPLSFAAALAVNGIATVLLTAASLAPLGAPTPAGVGLALLAGVVSLLGALLMRHLNRLRRRHFAALGALTDSETALRQLFMAVPVPLGLTRLSDGRVIKANAAALATFGLTAEEAEGLSSVHLYTDPTRRHALIDAVRHDGGVQGFEAELQLPDGSSRTFLLAATRVEHHGDDCMMVGATDISERKEIEASLMRLASTDQLTGLANRHHFFSLGEALQARARRFEEPLAVLMMDLDHFKAINDAHGHDTGDLVLLTFAQLCRAVFRESDVVARMGGEEFAVLLPATDLTGGLQVAERLRDQVAAYRLVPQSGDLVRFTVSIGVAELEFDELSLDNALMRADRALYHAKRTGRNCVGCAAQREREMSA